MDKPTVTVTIVLKMPGADARMVPIEMTKETLLKDSTLESVIGPAWFSLVNWAEKRLER